MRNRLDVLFLLLVENSNLYSDGLQFQLSNENFEKEEFTAVKCLCKGGLKVCEN